MTKEIQETIEGLMRIPGTKGDHEVILKTIKILKALEQAEGKLKEKEVYVTDSSKEMAVMSERAIGYNQAISKARPILAKAKLIIAELQYRLENVSEITAERDMWERKAKELANEVMRLQTKQIHIIEDELRIREKLQSLKDKLTVDNVEKIMISKLTMVPLSIAEEVAIKIKVIATTLIKELTGEKGVI